MAFNSLYALAITTLLEDKCARLTDRVFKCPNPSSRLRQELLLFENALEEFQKFCKEE